jgi:malonyl CoA-acyl carrier protein transacylase
MILLESIGRESELFWDVFYDDSVNGSCMLSVQGVNQEWLAAMLEDFDNVTLSLVNGPSNFVVSGSTDALQLFKDFAQVLQTNIDC